ncbi:hypothetical protein MSG28_008128 [Choristoneura fumiferana]|uniref:Uncharacterized protein n=1 Tax=Choristoneura fumiferana TaxID=7141 RepID=A0ACC0JA26_CHOFU|nr:hypothetical protein MSG28_008128 [Choristoneura fumiferana]
MDKSKEKEEQSIMDKSMRSVFVGNIPYEATEEKLKDIFSEVGPVLSFKLVFDRETGKPKGYGFCEYKDQETALSAMRNLNGYEIGGRSLRVDNACTEKSRMEMQALMQGPQNNPTEARNMLLQNPHAYPRDPRLAGNQFNSDPRMRSNDPRTQPKMPPQMPPGMPSMAQARTIQGIPSGASDQEKEDSNSLQGTSKQKTFEYKLRKMKFELFLLVLLCLLKFHVDCKWGPVREDWFASDTANEIETRRPQRYMADPPDHTKLIPMARYTLHNADWASIATVSVQPAIVGFPFSNVKSIADGYIANSTGIPYFYMSPLDFTAKDLAVKEGTPEYTFAKGGLFERHPAMANFPPDHDWFVAKLKIAQIAMVDYFGGAKYISVKDYLAYNYTEIDTTLSGIKH